MFLALSKQAVDSLPWRTSERKLETWPEASRKVFQAWSGDSRLPSDHELKGLCSKMRPVVKTIRVPLFTLSGLSCMG